MTRKNARPFTEKQIELATTFADQAAIAIQNVKLFDEVQAKTRAIEEALRYQTGSANILNVIASSPTNVQPVMKAIVESACELCGAYDAVALLKEGDDLLFSAHHGPIPMPFQKNPINRKWTAGRAFIDKKAVHVHDLQAERDEFPEGMEIARDMGHRSIVSVPLLREGESIGALVLRRMEVNPFSEKQIALLQTFANQAVIAIGNVRLFDEVQAKTRDLEESLQQQTATSEVLQVISSSPGDLEPVFQAMLENATRVCGAKFGIMNLYDGDSFESVALFNVPPAYAELRKNKWVPGQSAGQSSHRHQDQAGRAHS
jgi:GAF domain-containing protein